MDFSELDDLLGDTDYVPTFGRSTKPAVQKPLLKNSSAKSIDSGVGEPLTANNKLNFLDMNKDKKKETTTFQDFFKQSEAKNEAKRERSVQSKQQPKEIKQIINKNDFNPNTILDDDDDAPAVGRRNMKPPLTRKGQDGKSVGTKKDDNKSVTSVSEFRKTGKPEQKAFLNNFSAPTTSPIQLQQKQLQQTLKTQFAGSHKDLSQKETGIASTINFDFKAIIQQQLKLQRQLNQKLMNELQESHKTQIEKLNKFHQEQIKRRLQLKDLQLKTTKQHYELKIKSISDRVSQVKQMEQASNKIAQGIKALQRAEKQFKSKSFKLQQQIQSKSYQNKSIESFYNEKENNIKQMASQLEARQRQFRQEKQTMWQNLQRQSKKNQQFQAKIAKRQRQSEDQYAKKMRKLEDEFDQKSRKLNDQQSKLRYNKLQFQQQKLRLQQEKEQNLTRMKKWQESRLKMIEQLQLQKAKLLTRQSELNAIQRECEMKQNDLVFMEKQVTSKAKFIDLERKKNEVESANKKKTATNTFYGNFTRQFKQKFDQGPTVFQKSLKQLKDEYLRNLGHI